MVIVRRSFESETPKLYICSTPIGNLGDVSFRLLEILRSVDVVAAEDTRHTRKLLAKYDIHVPILVSYHQHNAESRADDFRQWWKEGKSIAVVSDAGTPCVSDPGEHAAALAVGEGVPVVPIPGASAVLSALVASGMQTQPFAFVGFLPREHKKCTDELRRYREFPGVVVFYEAPHRLQKTVERIHEVFPNHRIVLAKELTKQHEAFIYGTSAEMLEYLKEDTPRGEYVIIVDVRCSPMSDEAAGNAEPGTEADVLQAAMDHVRSLLAEGLSHTEAVKQVAKATGVRKRELYNATLAFVEE